MGRAVPAVGRALDILELLLDEDRLSAPEIAQRLRLPRTTVHELLGTLVERSYLAPAGGQPVRYRLGMRLFQLGGAFAGRLDLAREARQVAEVAASCDETVHVAVLDGTEVVHVAKVDSTHPVRMVSAVGRRLPAHCTGVGKVLLSGLDPAALRPATRAAGRCRP
jgi:IclR family KDG regulon transcriptional repressor